MDVKNCVLHLLGAGRSFTSNSDEEVFASERKRGRGDRGRKNSERQNEREGGE